MMWEEPLQIARDIRDSLHRQEGLLTNLLEADTETGELPIMRRRHPFVFVTDASGNGSVSIQVPVGWTWNLLRYAAQVTGAVAGGYFAIYRNIEDGGSLLGVTPGGAIMSDLFAGDGDIITGGESILVVSRSLGATVTVAGNIALRATQDTTPARVE